ncbi:MAG: 1-acyl-sn-glycerol-3-phosphate acyltransferase [Bacteriovoracaceae bacterium]
MFRKICYLGALLQGWKFKPALLKDLKSYVLVGAPHTSNWDFLPAVGLMYLIGDPKFIIKKSWLKFPMSLILKPMGAFGVERNQSHGAHQTDVLADIFKSNDHFIMMISPEGTRSPNDQWKTGFYTVAQKAGVPIVLSYADYSTKTVGIAKIIYPKDYESDMKEIMSAYREFQGKVPQNFKLDKRFI